MKALGFKYFVLASLNVEQTLSKESHVELAYYNNKIIEMYQRGSSVLLLTMEAEL